jgi:glycosyltransferase involved in cell wall biosynthesis
MADISVVMSTFNGSVFLEEQLNSLAIQSSIPSELIVVDDCSTDNTVTIIQRFAKRAPFPVHLQRNQFNKG